MNSHSAKFTPFRRRRSRRAFVAILAGGAALSLLTGAEAPPSAPRSLDEGAFSEAQVVRGRRGYNALCARCHGEELGGGEDSPALVDKVFFKGWGGKSIGELVEYTRTEMPSDGPGKVTRKQSTDITTYVLSLNGFPKGETELPPDLEVLNQILITPKK
jgi:S-disulfanyl-L-cysteine oxidoreductase SoxD